MKREPKLANGSKPLFIASAEADAKLIADAWRTKGDDQGVLSMFMWQWLHDLVMWEVLAMRDRVRYLKNN